MGSGCLIIVDREKAAQALKHLPKLLNQSPDLEMLEPFFPRLTQRNKDVLQTIKIPRKQQDQQKAQKSLSR
jgi:hypothetical protein